MSLVQDKVSSDASRLLYDDALFCHLVEEVLQFEKELRGKHSYPPALLGLLHILLEDTVLQKWLSVEKKSEFSARLSVSKIFSPQFVSVAPSHMIVSALNTMSQTFIKLSQ